MQKLIKGLHAFQNEVVGSYRELFAKLATGQNPEVLMITCSDSRIVPSLITQTDPGDMFVLRNVGNVVPALSSQGCGEAAIIEYAVGVLGVSDVVVCGHSDCGAMRALLNPESTANLPAVRNWLAHAEGTRRIVEDHYTHLSDPNAKVTAAAEENVLVQLDHLQTHPMVRSAIARGKLRLHAWMFKIETGEVFQYDHAEGQYVGLDATALRPRQPKAMIDVAHRKIQSL